MQIALLDPALFSDALPNVPARQTHEIERDLDHVVSVLGRKLTIADDYYWKRLDSALIAPLLAQRRSRQIQAALGYIRRRTQPIAGATLSRATVWSFRELFDSVPGGWTGEAVVSAARVVAANHDVTCIVRLVSGRNLKWHGMPEGAITEKTTWNLRVGIPGRTVRIPCVATVRNVDVNWTCR